MVHYRLLPSPCKPRRWNLFIFALEIALFIPALWWIGYSHLPAPGWSVACLAVAAALMTIHDRMTDWQKFGWLILMAFFLVIELRAISKDRWDSQVVQQSDRDAERNKFDAILTQQTNKFGAIIGQQQVDFSTTMRTFESAQNAEHKDFAGVLAKQQGLFEHESSLAESLSGVLTPGTEPTPSDRCLDGTTAFGVMFGRNTAIAGVFPFYVVRSVSQGPLITLKRRSDGLVVIVMDVKDKDGKIIARFDEDGYVIGSKLRIQRPDNSSLIVYDQYGQKAVEVYYKNPRLLVFASYIYAADQKWGFPGGRANQNSDDPKRCANDSNQDMIVIP